MKKQVFCYWSIEFGAVSIGSFHSVSYLTSIPVLSVGKAVEKQTSVLLLLFLHFHKTFVDYGFPEILVYTLATLQCFDIQMLVVKGTWVHSFSNLVFPSR